jgi:glutamine cyclotransferase
MIPHTSNTFCQGLVFYKNYLYESSGLYAKSFIQKYLNLSHIILDHVILDPNNSDQIKRYYFKDDIFIEGLTIFNDKLICVSWKNPNIYIFDLNLNLLFETNLKKINLLNECWGLTTDNKYLIISDGSNQIYFLDPLTLKIIKQIKTSIYLINAMTYANNMIYANIWYMDIIVCINPLNGHIIKFFDTKNKLIGDKSNKHNILNGIAHYKNDYFFLTGKNWNKIYLVQIKNSQS